jgi:hypothetical protein
MSNLISAVTPSEAPQTGVKRPLQGAPDRVPNNLPAFRGVNVGPAAAIKVPKLSQGNRPNEGSNVCIVYNRIAPLELINTWVGRCAPGDVLFVHKLPPGFTRKMVRMNNANQGGVQTAHVTNSHATMTKICGLDGLNRLLHGEGGVNGWVLNENVLRIDGNAVKCPADVAFSNNKQAEAEIARHGNACCFEPPRRRFRLAVLDDWTLDGVVKSNDTEASTTNGRTDAVVMNVAIQGSTQVNNGYLAYDELEDGNSTLNVRAVKEDGTVYVPNPTADGVRTVEAYPRGSLEAANHVNGLFRTNAFGKTGSRWLSAQVDFIANFAGQYSTFPTQMWDRRPQVLDTIYIGLRAYPMSAAQLAKLVDPETNARPAGLDTPEQRKEAAARKLFWFFQYVPMSGRKAYLAQAKYEVAQVGEDREDTPEYERAKKLGVLEKLDLGAGSASGKKHKFDRDPFDAVRTNDLKNMVGAWSVGKILDTRSMTYATYEGGPMDGASGMRVEVQTEWIQARALPGGSGSAAQGRDNHTIEYMYMSNRVPPTEDVYNDAVKKRNVDIGNARFPSMRTRIGSVFGVDVIKVPSTETVVDRPVPGDDDDGGDGYEGGGSYEGDSGFVLVGDSGSIVAAPAQAATPSAETIENLENEAKTFESGDPDDYGMMAVINGSKEAAIGRIEQSKDFVNDAVDKLDDTFPFNVPENQPFLDGKKAIKADLEQLRTLADEQIARVRTYGLSQKAEAFKKENTEFRETVVKFYKDNVIGKDLRSLSEVELKKIYAGRRDMMKKGDKMQKEQGPEVQNIANEIAGIATEFENKVFAPLQKKFKEDFKNLKQKKQDAKKAQPGSSSSSGDAPAAAAPAAAAPPSAAAAEQSSLRATPAVSDVRLAAQARSAPMVAEALAARAAATSAAATSAAATSAAATSAAATSAATSAAAKPRARGKSPPKRAPQPRPQPRPQPQPQSQSQSQSQPRSSMVTEVFESIMGGSATSAGIDPSPASPTPSAGSGSDTSAGPKTFAKRPR